MITVADMYSCASGSMSNLVLEESVSRGVRVLLGQDISISAAMLNETDYLRDVGWAFSDDSFNVRIELNGQPILVSMRDLSELRPLHQIDEPFLISLHQALLGWACSSLAKNIEKYRLLNLIEKEDFSIALQPIVDMSRGMPVGYEALVRFGGDDKRPVSSVFLDADYWRRRESLELAAARKAMQSIARIPQPCYLSINLSPHIIPSLVGQDSFIGFPSERLVIEITEHFSIVLTQELRDAMMTLRKSGIRFALDDFGAGYANINSLLQLSPEIIKLDRSLVSDIDTQSLCKPIVAGMLGYANQAKAVLIAEGIEREAEMVTLADLGVSHGQGYLFGEPQNGLFK